MNINQVTLIGRIVQTPVSKEFAEDKRFTKFTVATNEFLKKSDAKKAEFHNVVAFGKLAELCKDLLNKGKLVYIQGKLRTSRWEDSNKVLHTTTDIIAQKMLLLEKKQALANADSSESGEAEAIIELTPEMIEVAQKA
jgi:single-strand DNA-binding protein